MIQAKWLKLCATAFLSIGILAACGNDSDAPDLEEENVDVEEEEESVPTDGGTDADGSPGGDDNDNADTEEDSED